MKDQKKLGNKGFSLVELIVVIAIMAVLIGVLAPTLIGNIEKSRESKDLSNLDTIYKAVNTALAEEGAAKTLSAGVNTFTIEELCGQNNVLGRKVKEITKDAKSNSLSASCHDGSAKIYVTIDKSSLKVTVYAGTSGTPSTMTKNQNGQGGTDMIVE